LTDSTILPKSISAGMKITRNYILSKEIKRAASPLPTRCEINITKINSKFESYTPELWSAFSPRQSLLTIVSPANNLCQSIDIYYEYFIDSILERYIDSAKIGNQGCHVESRLVLIPMIKQQLARINFTINCKHLSSLQRFISTFFDDIEDLNAKSKYNDKNQENLTNFERASVYSAKRPVGTLKSLNEKKLENFSVETLECIILPIIQLIS
jgi:hypothetical protein